MTDEQIDAMTAHRWFAHHFGAGMNGLSFALKSEVADKAMQRREELTTKLIDRVADLTARVAALETYVTRDDAGVSSAGQLESQSA